MGTIIYKPHCARCGAIIDQEITYSKFAAGIEKGNLYRGSCVGIQPYSCSNCGEVFETIEIPIPKKSEE